MSSPYQAYPYRGEQTETSMLQRLLDLVNTQQPSSLPPSDSVTLSNTGTYNDQGQWVDTLPNLNPPASPTKITPQDVGKGILATGEALVPVDPIGFQEGGQQFARGYSQLGEGGANVGQGVLNMLGGTSLVGASLIGGYSGKATRPIKPIAEKALSKVGREVVPGGEFLMSKRKRGKNVLENVTGKSYNKSFISVVDSDHPHMAVDEDSIIPDLTYEQLKKEKGTLSRINLFRKGAGWKWAKGNKFSGKLSKVAGDDAVISVHRGDKHYFALSTELNSPTAMQTYPKGGNPTLKPTTKGVPQFGKVVGHINVRGKKHPLYDRITFGEKSGKPDAILNYDIRGEKDLPTAIRKARREKHLIPDMSIRGQGKYVGAPNWVRSKTDVEKMRDDFDAQVAGGVLGADWYDRVKGFTKSVSGGSKEKENALTEAFALWSAQANPDTNMGWAIQALNQYARGQRGSGFDMVKTGSQSKTFLGSKDGTILNRPLQHGDTRLGPKTQVYHDQMNFNVPKPLTGTNDIWHGRAFGYLNPDGKPFSRGFTPQEHVFLDNETALAVDRANKRKLGGRSNWTPGELQASAWVYAKGKAEFDKYPNKFKDLNGAIEWAKLTYPDYLQKYSAFGTSEAIPGAGTGHLPALLNTDYMTKKQFTDDVPGFYGTNQDVISEGAGMLGPGTREATGIYTPPGGVREINPAQAHQILVDLVDSPDGKTINAGTQDMLNAVEATRGYIDMQNGSAWHKFFPVEQMAKSRSSDSMRIETGQPLTEEEMRNLSDWAFSKGFYLSDNGKSVVIWPGYDSFPQLGMPLKGLDDVSYRGQHKAPRFDDDYSVPIHKLDKIYPDDFYSKEGRKLYGNGPGWAKADKEVHDLLLKIKDKPDEKITVYRAVPKDSSKKFNYGDWVTPYKNYVKDWEEDGMKIIKKQVRAGDLFSDGNSMYEFGYAPNKVIVPEGEQPTGQQVKSLFEGLGETKTRQRVPGYLDELQEMFPDKKIERGRVLSGYVDYYGDNHVSNSALENAGRSLRTKTLFEKLDKVPGVLASLDKSREFKQLIMDNIQRANDWSKKMNSPLRQDHMNALEIIKTKGLVGLRKAMKEGAVLPAVALPILGSAYQLAGEQGIEG